MYVCVCVSVCDSSSETGDEWASTLGTAEAIFSTGLYNGTGGGGGGGGGCQGGKERVLSQSLPRAD